MFSGSYHPDDVTFLLKPVQLAPIAVAEKERLIQSGQRHYSEMISAERLPSRAYLEVFHQALAQERVRFARDLLRLAHHLATIHPQEVTVVSLARAGTAIGVLLVRALQQLLNTSARHYSISIIRDRGMDEVALRYILARHPVESVVFVDGWTGKGVIAAELLAAVTRFNNREKTHLNPGLYTVADLCGAAAWSATSEDYLIPSSVLGATISGLVSRSILNEAVVGPGDFHGCVYYEEFAAADLSRWFVDEIFAEMEQQVDAQPTTTTIPAGQANQLKTISAAFMADMRRRFGVRDVNHIKPGLGEATRVLLRRVPDCLLVRDPDTSAVAHLLLLAREKHVPLVVDANLPYTAAALIKELDG